MNRRCLAEPVPEVWSEEGKFTVIITFSLGILRRRVRFLVVNEIFMQMNLSHKLC